MDFVVILANRAACAALSPCVEENVAIPATRANDIEREEYYIGRKPVSRE